MIFVASLLLIVKTVSAEVVFFPATNCDFSVSVSYIIVKLCRSMNAELLTFIKITIACNFRI